MPFSVDHVKLCQHTKQTTTMAATTPAITTFPLFSALPFELRDRIWREALPHPAGPALYFYPGRGCWVSRPLTESDPGFMAGNDGLAFEFRTDRLDHDNQFDLPLVFVNHEARAVALAWLCEQVSACVQEGRGLLLSPSYLD